MAFEELLEDPVIQKYLHELVGPASPAVPRRLRTGYREWTSGAPSLDVSDLLSDRLGNDDALGVLPLAVELLALEEPIQKHGEGRNFGVWLVRDREWEGAERVVVPKAVGKEVRDVE